VRAATWRDTGPREADFFAAKGVLGAVLEVLGAGWSLEAGGEPFLHPGRAAKILVDGQAAGWLGEVHPLVASNWDLTETVAAFELDLDAVPEPPTTLYEDVTTFPEVREDLAVVVSDDISAAQVIDVIRAHGAPLLRTVELFDVYRDPERLGEGNVSLALRLSYRAVDRTLTDEEVAAKRQNIAQALAERLGGRVRAA
jgi:phenylalanyl-tRNA synthetase beta chain